MKPTYATRCAMMCSDRRGAPRQGDQWVHLWGLTQWVCASCAEYFGRQAGIPTRAQVRKITRAREARAQMRMSLGLAAETHIPETNQTQT